LIGFLLEHYAGAFPTWLSPTQVLLTPVSEKHNEGALRIAGELKQAGIRVDVDNADETLGNKIRKGTGRKIPYIVVVGDKELADEEWMIRIRGQENQEKMGRSEFVEKVLSEIKNRN
jgi:threonyl-tRNA synthetase